MSVSVIPQPSLENYLATEFQTLRGELNGVERVLRETANTFGYVTAGGQWPYEFVAGAPPESPREPSQGTLAMILLATGRLVGNCTLEDGPCGGLAQIELPKDHQLRTIWVDRLGELIISLFDLSDLLTPCIRSGTFGPNNPMTTSHVAELAASLTQRFSEGKSALDGALSTTEAEYEQIANGSIDLASPLIESFSGTYQVNAFVPLRAIRAARAMRLVTTVPAEVRSFFESRLHEQLSFSSIPDSRFDPAELLFCLEGLLICARDAVDSTLMRRVLEVLAEKQNTSAHWRPTKPILASETGRVMLPLSVEGANSLLNSVAIMDLERPGAPFTAMALPLLQRFWVWLRARAVHFEFEGKKCAGWHSEHVNSPNLIHTWDTSQVLEFMIGYRQLLERHLAETTLRLSGVSVRYPKDLSLSLKWNGNSEPTWTDVADLREPIKGLTSLEHVYDSIGTEFVRPWQELKRTNLSMLIYGPPGTGKTSLAELIADTLQVRMLTVTVSDFLGSGGAMVEARAKAVFDMLIAQADVVILFDEIDAFLLDRDSPHYREQDTLFKFLTPGMLTKIANLRSAARSMFVIATNYENRIDPAIKRPGRVDRRYLIMPPDKARRGKILEALLEKRDEKLSTEQVDDLAKESVYLGYKEIEGAIAKAGGENAAFDDLTQALESAGRSTGYEQYFERLGKEQPYPAGELMAIIELAKDADVLAGVNDAVRSLSPEQQAQLGEILG